MGRKRAINSGRLDTMGRPIMVSEGSQKGVDNKGAMIVDGDGYSPQRIADSMSYDDACDALFGGNPDNYNDEVIAELKKKRKEMIDNVPPSLMNEVYCLTVSEYWEDFPQHVVANNLPIFNGEITEEEVDELQEEYGFDKDEFVEELEVFMEKLEGSLDKNIFPNPLVDVGRHNLGVFVIGEDKKPAFYTNGDFENVFLMENKDELCNLIDEQIYKNRENWFWDEEAHWMWVDSRD